MNSNTFSTLEFDRILDHLSQLAITPAGREQILQLHPLSDLSTINRLLSEVTELRDILDFDDPLPLSDLQDIRSCLRKAQIIGNFLTPEELIRVLSTCQVARKINDYFRERKEKYPHLSIIVNQIISFPSLEKAIARCIDPSTMEILDSASPQLNRLRRAIETQEQRIRKRLESLVGELSRNGYLQENLIAVRDGSLVLMVKSEHRGRVKGLIHDQSATGSTLFIEPFETLELNNQVRALKLEERREIERILTSLTDLIREQLQPLQQTMAGLAQLDFIYAKARFSQQIGGTQPGINDHNKLELVKAKHPLLVLRFDTGRPVVPLDLTMGDQFRTLVISGPNAGGKTVALKTIGLLCLMTACGLHIPADPSSNIPIVASIFAAIGDKQSIDNDLSTFSSHIADLREILEHVTQSSLVLIDEIGAGTDPDEGAALAIALLEKLTAIGCLTVVSTHQSALKIFAHETPGVENGSMEFNRDTLEPTYHFRLGIPGSSYAYEIATRWGLPSQITDRARELIGSKKNHFEKLLEDLENRLQRNRSISNELSIKQSELDGLLQLYRKKYDELIHHERELKRKAIDEARQIVQEANRAVEQAIRQIKEQQASRTAIQNAHQLIKQQQERLQQVEQQVAFSSESETSQDAQPSMDQIVVGQAVLWIPYQSIGTIIGEPDSAGKVLIQTGDVKIKVPVSELRVTQLRPEASAQGKINLNFKPAASDEIDVRGLRVDDALIAVDKFLDEAILSGLEKIYIIHGKGTGALRQAIHEFLDKNLRVKSKGFPKWSLGDMGMTVVELK
ncbi:MAG: endonuclease MutS2 [candidate division KSB1 bacterium]|nr:endonuclease MutS2 [candidate division KSB1 bacterium]MDZ7335384.1 endonuclease MutS2 [candidate division KSB1 bacterium]MDZ7357664.1 endonuclease MutS2 [candidate division KSB1 bacterium]MDZ7401543.1 endonuclease MutS2 [candidate division KSB1 bacterium]